MVTAVQVDERDGGWEDSDPTFKVILYDGCSRDGYSWAVDTWDLSDCGVLDAIRWAQDHVRSDGAWAIGVIQARTYPDPIGEEIGFTYLEGFDPNVQRADMSDWERRQIDVMLRRSTESVVLDAPIQ